MDFIDTDFDGVVARRQRRVVRSPIDPDAQVITTVVATNIPWRHVDHSPDGFEWGYGGSGPSDFALNILLHFGCTLQTAYMLHHDFTQAFLTSMPYEGDLISGAQIRAYLAARQQLL